jgi:hypothetical protein
MGARVGVSRHGCESGGEQTWLQPSARGEACTQAGPLPQPSVSHRPTRADAHTRAHTPCPAAALATAQIGVWVARAWREHASGAMRRRKLLQRRMHEAQSYE